MGRAGKVTNLQVDFSCVSFMPALTFCAQASRLGCWLRRYVDTGESGRGLYEENIAVKARLVLHFDINKTILMTDRAQGANTAHMINVLLCECAWGRLEPGPAWVPVGRLATDRCVPSHSTAAALQIQP